MMAIDIERIDTSAFVPFESWSCFEVLPIRDEHSSIEPIGTGTITPPVIPTPDRDKTKGGQA